MKKILIISMICVIGLFSGCISIADHLGPTAGLVDTY